MAALVLMIAYMHDLAPRGPKFMVWQKQNDCFQPDILYARSRAKVICKEHDLNLQPELKKQEMDMLTKSTSFAGNNRRNAIADLKIRDTYFA